MKKNISTSINFEELLFELDSIHINTEILENCFELDNKKLFSNELVFNAEFNHHTRDQNPKLRSQILQLANQVSRNRKNKLYALQKSRGKLRILAEGDSWFEYPLKRVEDTLDHLGKYYAVKSLAGGGDELRNMFGSTHYLDTLRSEKPSIFLLSAGGNDFLGNSFQNFLQVSTQHFGSGDSNNYLNNLFYSELEALSSIFEIFFAKILNIDPHIKILVHGYDYIIPRLVKKNKSIGNILQKLNIKDEQIQKDIIRSLIDNFNQMLVKATQKYSGSVYHVDVRNTIQPHHWYDEIHPNSKGYLDISIKFMKKIDSLMR